MSTTTAEPGRLPLSSRINGRLITIAVVFGILVGYPAFTFVKHSLSHGIEQNGDRKDVDLKSLGHFVFDAKNDSDAAIPPQYKELDGQKVALEGYIVSDTSAGNTLHNRFQFVYNVQKCCYGGPPLVQERVYGIVPKHADIAAPDVTQEVRCIGVLHVKLERDPGTHECTSLYTMDIQRVEQL